MIEEKADCINPTVSPLSLKINADCIFPLARKVAATALHLIQPAAILSSEEGMQYLLS